MSSTSDVASVAIRTALDATSQTVAIEEGSAKIRANLSANQSLLSDFDASLPRSLSLRASLQEKQELIAQKRSDLISLQSALIKTLRTQSEPLSPDSLKAIPIVMSRVQHFVYHLTEGAIEQKALAVPIAAVFGVTDALGKLYDVLVETRKLPETAAEREERVGKYNEVKQEVRALLQKISAREKAAKEAEEAAKPEEPKVESPGEGAKEEESS
jgi:hypothetical protein